MLENLFAKAGQEQAFLWLTVSGFLLGAMLHVSGMVRRNHRFMGSLCDVMAALGVLVMLLSILLRFGGGIRAYGVLGIIIGLLLYYAGFSRLVEAFFSGVTKIVKRRQKTCRPKEGFPASNAEIISTNEAARRE